MRKVLKWLNSQAAGIIYAALSLVFLWMTTNAVKLYDTFPEFFGNDAMMIIGLLLLASVVLYTLFVIIFGYYVPDEYRWLFNILFIMLSSIYVVIPLCSRPSLVVTLMDMADRMILSIL
jgi:succinate dehydrogenase hydrophobic anchor subunit